MKISEDEYSRRVKLFTDKVFWWQKRLGFNEVEFFVFGRKSNNYLASWNANSSGMCISIFYSTKWLGDQSIDDLEIDKVAFHEVFESQFHQIGGSLHIFYSEEHVAHMIHGIVRKAENAIYPVMKE